MLKTWLSKRKASKKDLQSLMGVLNHLGAMIIAGRVYSAAILDTLRSSEFPVKLTTDFYRDIQMWYDFLTKSFPGKSIMKSAFLSVPNAVLSITVHKTSFLLAHDDDIMCFDVISADSFTEAEMFAIATWQAARIIYFQPDQWVTVAIPTISAQDTINRVKTQNTKICALIRESCAIQVQGDFVLRGLRHPDSNLHSDELINAVVKDNVYM